MKAELFHENGVAKVRVNGEVIPSVSFRSFWPQPGITKAWHMNKNHWLGVLLDGSAEDQTIKELLDVSYSLTE